MSVAVALGLLLAKLYGWLTTGSAAVLGSAADSGLDLLGSAVAFGAVRYAAQPADSDHRFGHQKAEGLAAMMQAIVISASAIFVAYEGISRLVDPQPLRDAALAMRVLGLATLVTIALVAFQTVAARRSGSLVIRGDRAHYVGDVIANLGALLAVLLADRYGLLRADGAAALLASAFLLWSVRGILLGALPQVMDQELPDADRRRIATITDAVPGVMGHHALRTRMAGRRRYIQIHLEMDPYITLLQSHDIADEVEERLKDAFPDAEVITHQDPYGHEDADHGDHDRH